jgi:uncharacterized membrane protein (UPF0127 family)
MYILFILLVAGFFGYPLCEGFFIGSDKQDLFVFAFSSSSSSSALSESYNSIKEFFANSNVGDSEYLKGYATVDNYKILVDIAITDKQVQEGLAIKNSLNENEAMLFFLGEPEKASFWMKNMKFPIDIIWLNENFSIVHMEHELEPCKSTFDCKSYTPNAEALYVLETINGFAKKHNLEIGDKIQFELIQ